VFRNAAIFTRPRNLSPSCADTFGEWPKPDRPWHTPSNAPAAKRVAAAWLLNYHTLMYDERKSHDFSRQRRADGRALTRQRLCLAAIEEIAAKGVAGISIERISERAGLTRGAFYYNYDSKYSLLADVLFVVSEDEINLWINIIEDVENLDTLFSRIRDNVDKFFDEKGLLLVELEMAARRSSEFAAYFRDSERKVQMACEGLVAALARKVGIAIDIGLSATMVSSMASGLALGGPRSDGITRGTIMITFLKLLLKT